MQTLLQVRQMSFKHRQSQMHSSVVHDKMGVSMQKMNSRRLRIVSDQREARWKWLTFSKSTQGTGCPCSLADLSKRKTCLTRPELCTVQQLIRCRKFKWLIHDALQIRYDRVWIIAEPVSITMNSVILGQADIACSPGLIWSKVAWDSPFTCPSRPCRNPARLMSMQGKPADRSSVPCVEQHSSCQDQPEEALQPLLCRHAKVPNGKTYTPPDISRQITAPSATLWGCRHLPVAVLR